MKKLLINKKISEKKIFFEKIFFSEIFIKIMLNYAENFSRFFTSCVIYKGKIYLGKITRNACYFT